MSDAFMKDFWEGAGWTALIVFIFAPWMLGLAEGISIFLTGNVLTNVPWEPIRIVVALSWPVLWFGVFMACYC